jgi:hypothetical protein
MLLFQKEETEGGEGRRRRKVDEWEPLWEGRV